MKYGANNASSGFVAEANMLPSCIILGKIAVSTVYATVPEIRVETYAITTVRKRIFPALFPRSPMPGATNPTIMRGITKPRKFPKIPLKVARLLTTTSGI